MSLTVIFVLVTRSKSLAVWLLSGIQVSRLLTPLFIRRCLLTRLSVLVQLFMLNLICLIATFRLTILRLK